MHIHSDALPGKRAGMAALILLCACFSAADAPSRFDYYVLSLRWSPQYCAQARGHEPQCACPYAFVVHGLSPQYERGYPSVCRTNARTRQLFRQFTTRVPRGRGTCPPQQSCA